MHNVQPFTTEQRPLGFLVEILYKGVLLFHFFHLFAVMAFIVIVTLTLFLVCCCWFVLFVWSYLDAIWFTYSYILLFILSFTMLQMLSRVSRQPSMTDSPKVRIITRCHHLSIQSCDHIFEMILPLSVCRPSRIYQ